MFEDSFTSDEIERLVSRSGYPFEISVGKALLKAGYQVRPSFRFLDRDRNRDYEIGIVADKMEEVKLSDGSNVQCSLRLVIECKSSRLPYVLFGLPSPEPTPLGTVDPDLFYLHINSSRDHRHPNRYAAFLFLRKQEDIRASHHYFSAESYRFHHSAVVEVKGDGPEAHKKAKLNVSDNVSEAIRKLAGFADNQHETWQGILCDPGGESLLQGKPHLKVFFFLLVHPGHHYRWTDDAMGLRQAGHTTVFYAFSFRTGAVSLVVDFASLESLPSALSSIEASYEAVINHCVPALLNDKGMP
jgi:hypothetical protein